MVICDFVSELVHRRLVEVHDAQGVRGSTPLRPTPTFRSEACASTSTDDELATSDISLGCAGVVSENPRHVRGQMLNMPRDLVFITKLSIFGGGRGFDSSVTLDMSSNEVGDRPDPAVSG